MCVPLRTLLEAGDVTDREATSLSEVTEPVSVGAWTWSPDSEAISQTLRPHPQAPGCTFTPTAVPWGADLSGMPLSGMPCDAQSSLNLDLGGGPTTLNVLQLHFWTISSVGQAGTSSGESLAFS